MTDLKALEGKEVYLWPTGNAARLWKGEPKTATITKVARVYVTLDNNPFSKFRFEGNKLRDSNGNTGYIVFETLKDFNNHKELLRLSDLASDRLRYKKDWENLGLENVKSVFYALGWDGEL